MSGNSLDVDRWTFLFVHVMSEFNNLQYDITKRNSTKHHRVYAYAELLKHDKPSLVPFLLCNYVAQVLFVFSSIHAFMIIALHVDTQVWWGDFCYELVGGSTQPKRHHVPQLTRILQLKTLIM